MKLSNLFPVAAIAAAALCVSVVPSFAQEEEEEPILDTVPVLQGGFSYRDKRMKDYFFSSMTMLSHGTEILSGGRVREITDTKSCFDIVWNQGGIGKVDRTDKKLKYKQNDFLEITFVQFDCSKDEAAGNQYADCVIDTPCCVTTFLGTPLISNTVEWPKCSATAKTNAKQTVKNALPPVGKSKFQCSNGIEVISPEFGIGPGFQENLLTLYPDIRKKLKANFSDDAGTITDEETALDNLSPDLGLPLCSELL
jgi:hypothetical protein